MVKLAFSISSKLYLMSVDGKSHRRHMAALNNRYVWVSGTAGAGRATWSYFQICHPEPVGLSVHALGILLVIKLSNSAILAARGMRPCLMIF